MKLKWNKIYWSIILVWAGGIQAIAEPFAKGPYLGQTPPGPVAEVFAPGLICDTRPHRHETHGHFSADGNTFCFRRLGYVYITENTDQGWTTPKRIKSIPYKTWSACLSPDANTIYFLDQFFNRSARNRGEPSKHIYQRCTRSSRGWSKPKILGPPFSSAFGGFSVAADHSICFKSGQDCFRIAPFVGNTWGQAIKLPIEMDHLHGCDPGIAPDKSFLVFYSIRPGAQGGTPTDLYITLRRADGTWTKPHRMGPGINTDYYEMAARISPDKKYMFFTRSNGWNTNRATDTADIYWVALKEYLDESNDSNINQTDLEIGTNGLHEEPFAKGPYLGQTPPGPVAQVFAPGLISDTRPKTYESNGTFSADGNVYCYRRVSLHVSPKFERSSIFFTENSDLGWTTPKLIESIRESGIPAWGPCLSPDANSIYFTYANVKPISKRNIYRCDRTTDGWTMPQALGAPLSSPTSELTCSIAANNSMYIGSSRHGDKPWGISRICVVPYVNNTWQQSTYISLNNQQEGCPADPGIAPDESFMVFMAKDLSGGCGHQDLYLTLRLPDGTWSKFKNLGPRINSKYIEHSPRISPDKKYLFFTRATGWDSRNDSADIYWVALKEYLPESYR